MAGSSVQCGYPFWVDGATINGLLGRANHIAATFFCTPGGAVRGGVLPSGGQMAVTPGQGMTVTVATGAVVVPAAAGATGGGYLFALLSAATLDVAAADDADPRIDLVCAAVDDTGTQASGSSVEILTGTPTAGAALTNLNGAPALPAAAEGLAYVLVPANATTVAVADIDTVAAMTVAQGGILPVQIGSVPAGYTGMYVHDPVTGRLIHNPAAGPAQPHVLPFAAQTAVVTKTVESVSAVITLASVNITTDGVTDIEITATWPNLFALGGSGAFGTYGANMSFDIDGTQVQQVSVAAGCPATNNDAWGGATLRYCTSQAAGNTPAAGAHTVSLTMDPFGDGTHDVEVQASTVRPIWLRVAPVTL